MSKLGGANGSFAYFFDVYEWVFSSPPHIKPIVTDPFRVLLKSARNRGAHSFQLFLSSFLFLFSVNYLSRSPALILIISLTISESCGWNPSESPSTLSFHGFRRECK